MKHDHIYNHLNALEFLIVNRKKEWEQILKAIGSIDANQFLKISNDKTRSGEIVYNQVAINNEFKRILGSSGWNEKRTEYYVTSDIPTAKEIVRVKDAETQKQTIENKGYKALSTYNQVDFVKDRVAIEVQFGKYFSVAYDLHVKHTFFFLLDEIDVGIEIIPTHAMMRRMDSGVSWFENEITNVIREGRNNPSVPIVIIGIEPEDLIPEPKAVARAATARNKLDKIIETIHNVEIELSIARQKGNIKKIAAIENKLADLQEKKEQLQEEWDIFKVDAQRAEELKVKLQKNNNQ